jgi:hypothetical protein
MKKKDLKAFYDKELSQVHQLQKRAIENHDFGGSMYYNGALMELQYWKEFLKIED